MLCRHNVWNDLSITSEFDEFIDKHPDRDLQRLGPLKVKNILRNEWTCKTGDNGRRTEGRVHVRGVVWPDLEDLRNQFEAKHGPQQWLASEATGWLGGRERAMTEAKARMAIRRSCDDEDLPF